MIRSARRLARSDATRAPRSVTLTSRIVEGLSASAASALNGFYQDTGLQQGLRPADKMRAPRGRVDWGLRDQPLPGSLGVLDAIGRGVYPRLAAIQRRCAAPRHNPAAVVRAKIRQRDTGLIEPRPHHLLRIVVALPGYNASGQRVGVSGTRSERTTSRRGLGEFLATQSPELVFNGRGCRAEFGGDAAELVPLRS
jgi:hypothetical protein